MQAALAEPPSAVAAAGVPVTAAPSTRFGITCDSGDDFDEAEVSSEVESPVAGGDDDSTGPVCIASAADEARVADSAAAHTGRAHRRSVPTEVGVGCRCAWFLEQSRDGLTWLLVQRGQHSGHTPGDEESNSHLPLPAEWEHAAAAGVSIEDEDPAQAADDYLLKLHEARLKRDKNRVYSDHDGEPLPGFGRHDFARSPKGMFRARGGRYDYSGVCATGTVQTTTTGASESSECPPGRGSNAPFFCICEVPRGTPLDGPIAKCTRARMCLKGGLFHLATPESPYGCIPHTELDVDETYTCASCKKELHDAHLEEVVLRDDAAVTAGFSDDAVAQDSEVLDSVSATDAAISSLPTCLAAARTERGIPNFFTGFRSWCTAYEFSNITAARARAKRGGVRISAEFIPLLKR